MMSFLLLKQGIIIFKKRKSLGGLHETNQIISKTSHTKKRNKSNNQKGNKMLLTTSGVVRIATDLETKFTQDGKQITSFSVVSSDKWKTQSGEAREASCFVKATAFGGLAKILKDYCKKGSKIYIQASLNQDKWKDQQGNNKSMHSLKIERMEMLGSKQDNAPQQGTPPQNSYSQPAPSAPTSSFPEIDINEDEIPF